MPPLPPSRVFAGCSPRLADWLVGECDDGLNSYMETRAVRSRSTNTNTSVGTGTGTGMMHPLSDINDINPITVVFGLHRSPQA